MLDLGDLVIFTKVVETESFTKAGESARLSKIEDQPPHLAARGASRLRNFSSAAPGP